GYAQTAAPHGARREADRAAQTARRGGRRPLAACRNRLERPSIRRLCRHSGQGRRADARPAFRPARASRLPARIRDETGATGAAVADAASANTGRYSPSFGLSDLLLPAMRAGLLARFLLQGLGWWGARKRGVPLPCVTSVYTTSSHAPQRSVTSLRPATSIPVHVGLPHLRIPQRRSAFFPERSSPFPRRRYMRPVSMAGRREQ